MMSKNSPIEEDLLGPASIVARYESRGKQQQGDSKSLFDYADALRQIGRSKSAIETYQRLDRATVPESKRWLVDLYMGQAQMDAGAYPAAEESFSRATQAKPDSTVPLVYLSSALFAQEQFESSLQVLQRALGVEGDRDEVYLNMAYAHRALGRLEDAMYCLKAALSISPDYQAAVDALSDVAAAINYMTH